MVIVDIRASVERRHVSDDLTRLVLTLQPAVPTGLFQVAWGDEVEGVLPFPVDLWDLYIRTRTSLGEVPFYMGVGFGEASNLPLQMAESSVHELNGTAFKSARHALERAKRDKLSGIALAFDVYDSPMLTEALNGYPRMINAAFRQMTRKQRAYFEDLIVGFSHVAIAKRHGVSQPTVTKALQRAGADQLAGMRDGLTALLEFVAGHVQWGTGAGEASR